MDLSLMIECMNDYVDKLTNKIDYGKCYEWFSSCMKIGGIYLVYCLLHYFIPHVYVYFCVPITIFGFLMSPFMSQAPHCIALRWALNTVGNNIGSMFLLIAAWLTKKLFSPSVVEKD